jgi:mediator of RNA polymerase II transcription subunit 14
MEHQNGTSEDGLLAEKSTLVNGSLINGLHEPDIEELERELPTVHAGQVSLGDLISRVIHAIYAELTELSET